jgi:hypothetical protein
MGVDRLSRSDIINLAQPGTGGKEPRHATQSLLVFITGE